MSATSSQDGRIQDAGRLWAPWRNAFISQPRPRGCIFCLAKRSRNNRNVFVLARGRRTFVLLNRYPYTPGHLMVAAYRHVGEITRLTPEETSELIQTASRMTALLTQVFRSQAFNIGMNVGRAAGAGIPGHLHLHVVPRWSGDMNFMPVIGNAKVLSDSLDATYTRLTKHLSSVRPVTSSCPRR